jgi:molybdenum cofactor biosynthesis protein B
MSESPSVDQHRAEAPASLTLAVLTVSDTRTTATDKSGALIVELAEGAGHRVVARAIVPDEPEALRLFLGSHSGRRPGSPTVDAILVTGGTGVSPRDRTYEAVSDLLTKTIPGYGELFRMLSFQEIGSACILSRAIGGLLDSTVVLLMPGSRAAVELAMTKIILPELPHLAREARKT